jgi:drug/metabolite transporter (DMT)-like permease
VLASIAYAVGILWAQQLVERQSALVLTTASLVGAAVALLPFGLAQLPDSMPGWKVTGSVVALGVAGTAIGQLIYYRMVESDGSARTSLVTYLLPVTALFYGAGLLDEPITIEELVGLVLILAGVGLGSGLVRTARRREPATAPQ